MKWFLTLCLLSLAYAWGSYFGYKVKPAWYSFKRWYDWKKLSPSCRRTIAYYSGRGTWEYDQYKKERAAQTARLKG